MQDSLRLVFIFVGFVAIAAVLAHGYWRSRKQAVIGDEPNAKKAPSDPLNTQSRSAADAVVDRDGFDGDGIGKVRTVSRAAQPTHKEPTFSAPTDNLNPDDNPVSIRHALDEEIDATALPEIKAEPQESKEVGIEEPIFNDAEPDYATAQPSAINAQQSESEHFMPPPKSLMKTAAGGDSAGGDSAGGENARRKEAQPETEEKASAANPYAQVLNSAPSIKLPSKQASRARAAKLAEKSARPVSRAAVTEPAATAAETKPSAKAVVKPTEAATNNAQPKKASAKPAAAPQDVYVLNVAAKEGQKLEGAKLLPVLLTLGFKFGEMDIFHRHHDAAGTGPILFSMANMVKPGTFDLDNMEQFSTQGISLFFTVPSPRSASGIFNLMLQAAQKLAKSLDAQILDQHRNPLNEQAIRHTQSRIREFERQQLLEGKQG